MIPDQWNSSADTYAQYAIARTSSGSTTENTNNQIHSNILWLNVICVCT